MTMLTNVNDRIRVGKNKEGHNLVEVGEKNLRKVKTMKAHSVEIIPS
jgi:hypothetical protein